MSEKHTPGPWEVITELRPTDEIICDMLNAGYVAITQGQKLANWRDDARLIASAPALLAALKTAHMALIGYLPGHRNEVTDKAIADAAAAIDKATA
ncbi:hypothetical protein JQF37_01800 [Pseudomonas sp. MIL9]|uniref:hypothetical protein n=1 Tax=Pseudomonas sp. MIL9 TaxID=2807620 RepID=UPI00194F866A|nr:hypothetical protein [Pseudomonas sp. MIL9]MBM6442362.1 hypothetical protein [Pseudomonas sp. MIL9]